MTEFRIASHARPVRKALEIARDYAQTDGGHHKQWVIDQMLRSLLEDQYDSFVQIYEVMCGPESWDIGIAP